MFTTTPSTESIQAENKSPTSHHFTNWIQEVTNQLGQVETADEDVIAKLKKLQNDLKQIGIQQQQYQKQLINLRSQVDAGADKKTETIKTQIATLELKLTEMQEQKTLHSVISQFATLQQDHLTLKNNAEKHAKSNSTIRSQLQIVIENHTQQAQQLANWQSQFQNQFATHTHMLQTQLNQLKAVEEKVSQLEKCLGQFQQQITLLKSEDEEVQAQLKELHTILSSSVIEQTKNRQQQEAMQKQIVRLSQQINEEKDHARLQNLEVQLNTLMIQIQQLQSPLNYTETVAKQLKALQEEFVSQKKNTERLTKSNTELRKQLQASIDMSDKQAQQFANWQQELHAAQQAQTASVEELQTQLSQTKTALNKRLSVLEARVDKLEIKHDNLTTLVKSQDPKFTVAQKLLKLRTTILEDKFITDELKYYIAPNGEAHPGVGDHQPLHEWVQTEFLDSKATGRVLLLQGVAGAGKSTFNRFLLRQLWQDIAWQEFKPGMPAPKAYVPIFIPLGSSQIKATQLLKYLADLPELIDDFTDAEINVLKKDYQVLLIADGYDEMPGNQAPNLYNCNHLEQYEGRIKLLISCRSQRVQELKEADVFVPHNDYNHFKCRYVSPFNNIQIADYITKYLAQNSERTDIVLWKNAQAYLDQLSKLSDLKALLNTPFALLMGIEILPTIVEQVEKAATSSSESKESKTSIVIFAQLTRAKLYDAFMNHWFKRQADIARRAGDTTNAKELIRKYQKFCFKLAECLRAAGVTAVQYPFGDEELDEDLYSNVPKAEIDPKGPRGPWVRKLLGTDNEAMIRARRGAPLTIATGNNYQFIHTSFIDYFLTTAITEQIQPLVSDTLSETKKDEQTLQQDITSSSLETLLGNKIMTRDQWYLLADRIQQEAKLKAKLLQIIEDSKHDAKLATAAANAITVLNAAGENLSGYDFQEIRIPHADLSGALLHGTQLQRADLTNVNLQNAWLSESKFHDTNLKGIRFGEQAFIELKDCVTACEYSPDDRWLAIAGGKVIELYEATTSSLVKTLTGHTDDVNSVAWDVKSEHLASGSHDHTIRIWEIKSGRQIRELLGHADIVWSVAWDKKGEHLASGSKDTTVRIWEVKSGQELKSLRGHTNSVKSVTWDGEDKRLASASSDQTVRVWEVVSGRELTSLQGHTDTVTSISWDLKKERLATGSDDKTVKIWDLKNGQKLRSLEGHMRGITSVAWDAKGERLASGSWDKTVRVWEVESGRELRNLQGHTHYVNSITWNVQGDRLASGSSDKTVRTWEMGSNRELRSLCGHMDWVKSIIWDAQGKRLASGSWDNTVRVWEAERGLELCNLKGHTDRVMSIAWDAKGQRLASGSWDKTVRVWDVRKGYELYSLQGHTNCVISVVWDMKDEHLISVSNDNLIHMWDLENSKKFRNLWRSKGLVNSVAWDAKGERFAAGSNDYSVQVWEIGGSRELCRFKGHTDDVNSVAWDVNGERLASGSDDKTVRIWEVGSGRELRCLKEHTGSVRCVAWNNKGEYLASGSDDKTVRVWEVKSGNILFQISLLQRVSAVAFAPSNIDREETLAVAFGKGIGCFKLVSKESVYTSHLKWLAVDGAELHLSGLNITQAQGLSPENYLLLQQRGAVGLPAKIQSLEVKENQNNTPGDSKDESQLTGTKNSTTLVTKLGMFAPDTQVSTSNQSTKTITENHSKKAKSKCLIC